MADHVQPCTLHDSDRMLKCFGTLRRGGICSNRAKGVWIPGAMPMCHIHRHQIKTLGLCRAPLACGFVCGQLFEWKPHDFSLCLHHRRISTCYFLGIPVEIRCRIYQFLLPNGVIPAGLIPSANISNERFHAAILRVNHQIHEEAASLLYRTRTFTVEVSANTLIMCNMPKQSFPDGYPHNSFNLDSGFQTQLMLLEQQDAYFQRTNREDGIDEPQISAKSAWTPPLSEKYFTMIKSFRIVLLFGYPVNCTLHEPAPSTSYAEKQNVLSLWLFHYCDQLHKLIGRLQRSPNPIVHLEIFIKFSSLHVDQDAALHMAKFLLHPFRRLCKVVKPQVLSITIKDQQGRPEEFLCSGQRSSASRCFASYLKYWSRELCSSQPSIRSDPIVEAYWKLESVLSRMKTQDQNTESKFVLFARILQAARVAREANNFKDFKTICDQVVALWSEYLDNHSRFQSSVTQSIGAINSIVDSEVSSR